MGNKIEIYPILWDDFDTLMSRYGEVLSNREHARDTFWKFIRTWEIRKRPEQQIFAGPLDKETFTFLVAEGQIIESEFVRNYDFAEALFEFLTSHGKTVITNLTEFLDNLFQEVKYGSDVNDTGRIYNETFQASNGMWIATYRHVSGVKY